MSEKHQEDQITLNIFDLIDSICDDFRTRWKAGKRPQIQRFILKVPESAQGNLFRNLLKLEIDARRRIGETPQSSDYLVHFPLFKRTIRQAFDEYTLASMEALQSTSISDAPALAVTVDAPAANYIGDYELIRELGRGGMGVVYEARHALRGNRVALKTLPTGVEGQEVNAEKLHRFRREYRSLSEVNHRHLIGMQTLEHDATQWFLTMDIVRGEDWLHYVRPGDLCDEKRVRETLPQMAAG